MVHKRAEGLHLRVDQRPPELGGRLGYGYPGLAHGVDHAAYVLYRSVVSFLGRCPRPLLQETGVNRRRRHPRRQALPFATELQSAHHPESGPVPVGRIDEAARTYPPGMPHDSAPFLPFAGNNLGSIALLRCFDLVGGQHGRGSHGLSGTGRNGGAVPTVRLHRRQRRGAPRPRGHGRALSL